MPHIYLFRGTTALHAAAGSGAVKALGVMLDFKDAKMFADEMGLFIKEVDRSGNSAVIESVIYNKHECVGAVVVKGADNIIANNEYLTPMNIELLMA